MFSLSRISLLLSVCLLAACSGNGSSTVSSSAPNKYVNGYVGSSNVQQAQIQAVSTNVQGQATSDKNDDGELEYIGAKATSTNNAYYQVKIKNDDVGRVLTMFATGKDGSVTLDRCELPEGCGDGWAYRETKAVPTDFEWRASVGNAQDNMRININWITHVASSLAHTSYIDADGQQDAVASDGSQSCISGSTGGAETPDSESGIYTPFTVECANLWVSALFGISDIISVRPLAPSEIYKDPGLTSALRNEGILYGALLAAGQSLAKDADQSSVVWVGNFIDGFLVQQGQLYQKGGNTTSLYALYNEALQTLADSRTYFSEQNYSVPAELNQAISDLQVRMAALQESQYTNVSIPVSQVIGWLDRINNAKEFIADLNERLINYKGQDPNTCSPTNSSSDCVNSFIDPVYAAKAIDHYSILRNVYEGIAPSLQLATQAVRDLTFELIGCLHTGCAGNDRYNAETKTLTGSGLTLAMVPYAVTDGQTTEFNAFDFTLIGDLKVPFDVTGTLNVSFNDIDGTDSEGNATKEKARIRVVYEEASVLPPLPEEKEPLGFDVNWPEVKIPAVVGSLKQDFYFYFAAKLIGVKDPLDAVSPYHYNLTQISLALSALGVAEGSVTEEGETVELKDLANLILSGTTSSPANYYSDSLWPEFDDFFRIRDGYDIGREEIGMFEYRIGLNESVRYSGDVKRLADYIDVNIFGFGINRLEIFSDTDGEAGIRKCSVIVNDQEERETDLCTELKTTDEELNLQKIVDGDFLGLFSVPGRGAYRILFPDADDDGHYELDTSGTKVILDGRLEAVFTQGIDGLNLRSELKLVEGDERLPSAIVNLNLSRKSKDLWEFAMAVGYDYDWLVEILPAGLRAQSLYLSYLVTAGNVRDEDDLEKFHSFSYELGSLVVYRGGVKLFTDNPDGESIGMTIATLVDYELGDDAQPCGVINRKDQTATGQCNAIGYLTYRNAIVGVIREERDGIYVVRFSDGQFLVLGG